MAAGPTRPRGAVRGLLAVTLLLTSGAALAFLVGLPPQTEIGASGERPAPAPLPDLPSLFAKASGSAELRAADAIPANRIETWVLWGSHRASLERLVGGKL